MTNISNFVTYDNKNYEFVPYDDSSASQAACLRCDVRYDSKECMGLNDIKGCGGGVYKLVDQTPEKDGTLQVSATGGKKYDGNKPRPGLLLRDCNDAVKDIISVMELGAKKYGDRNWKNVENWRYDEAMMRHIIYGHIGGEILDSESKKAHLAHIACCVIFELQNLHDQKQV